MRGTEPCLLTVPLAGDEWSAAAAEFDDLSYQQTPAYVTEAALAEGAAAEVVAFRSGAQVAGLCAVRMKKIPGLPLGIAYVAHGPICRRNGDCSWKVYSECLKALSNHYVANRGLVLRVAPSYEASRRCDAATDAFLAAGFRLTGRPAKRTIMLAVDRDLGQIRRGLNGKWRNMLVQSERLPLSIVESTEPAEFAVMASLLTELERKKGFRSARDVAFFEQVQRRALSPRERLKLHFAYFEGRVVSASLTSFAGDTAVLLLAASNDEGRRTRAAHRIQWRIIEDAVQAGLRWYDTGGVDPQENPGVYAFKKGLNGDEVSELGVFERAPHRAAAQCVAVFETAYRGAKTVRNALWNSP